MILQHRPASEDPAKGEFYFVGRWLSSQNAVRLVVTGSATQSIVDVCVIPDRWVYLGCGLCLTLVILELYRRGHGHWLLLLGYVFLLMLGTLGILASLRDLDTFEAVIEEVQEQAAPGP